MLSKYTNYLRYASLFWHVRQRVFGIALQTYYLQDIGNQRNIELQSAATARKILRVSAWSRSRYRPSGRAAGPGSSPTEVDVHRCSWAEGGTLAFSSGRRPITSVNRVRSRARHKCHISSTPTPAGLHKRDNFVCLTVQSIFIGGDSGLIEVFFVTLSSFADGLADEAVTVRAFH